MKKLQVVFLLLFLSIISYGQNQLGLGIKSGITFTNQTWSGYEDPNRKLESVNGFSIRLSKSIFDFDFITTELELGYIQRGTKGQFSYPILLPPSVRVSTFEYKQHILLLALTAKLKYKTDIFSPYLIVGPQGNFVATANFNVITTTGSSVPIGGNLDAANTLGLTLGAGTEIKNLFPFTVLIEYRFETDLTKSINKTITQNINGKNYAHAVLIGFEL